MNDLERLVRSPQLRTLLQQLDAVALDASSIGNKLETGRLSPAEVRTWLAALREQLVQAGTLIAEIGKKLPRSP